MKEVSRKFSREADEPQDSPERSLSQPVRAHIPAAQDVRFVVKESFNLGFRFLTDIEQLFNKMNEGKPEQQDEPGTTTSPKH